jgi:hypothetical protein
MKLESMGDSSDRLEETPATSHPALRESVGTAQE